MGRDAGAIALTIGLAAVGGFVGGLFTAGAFSMTGASLGIAAAGFFTQQPGMGQSSSKPTVEGADFGPTLPEFCGTWGDVQGLVTCVGRDGNGDPAGVLEVVSSERSGKGGGPSIDTSRYFLTMKITLGRAMGGTLFDPEPLFVDKFEVEDADGRRCEYDRDGQTPDERGLELVQTVSGLTGRVICETSENVRFYTGTAEQMPDPKLLEIWGDKLSADRGTAHVVLIRYEVKSQTTFYFTLRSATTGRRVLIEQRLEACSIAPARMDLNTIPPDSTFRGRILTGQSTREWCEKAARRLFLDFAWDGQKITVIDRKNPTIHSVSPLLVGTSNASAGENSDDDEKETRLVLAPRARAEFASEVRVNFADVNANWASEPAIVSRPDAGHMNALEYDLGESATLGEAVALGRALRDEDAQNTGAAQFSVLPGHENWLVGDVVRMPLGFDLATGADLGTRDFLLLELQPQNDHTLRVENAVPHAAHVYNQVVDIIGPVRPEPRVGQFAAPLLWVFDGVPLSEREPDSVSRPGLLVAVSSPRTKKWKGAQVICGAGTNPASGTVFGETQVEPRATLGELTAPFAVGNATLAVKTKFGELANRTGDWGNQIAFENGLVASFETATVTDYDEETDEIFYTLSGLTMGRWGSEYALANMASGARFVLINRADGKRGEGLTWFDIGGASVGNNVTVRAIANGTRKNPKTDKTLVFAGQNAKPLAPQIETAILDSAGLRIEGRARSRFIENALQSNPDLHRQSEKQFAQGYKYELVMNDGTQQKTRVLYASDEWDFDFLVSSATLASLFGTAPSTLSGTLKMVGEWGAGHGAPFAAIGP